MPGFGGRAIWNDGEHKVDTPPVVTLLQIELGLRHDGGDAETGTGLELRARW